MQYRKPPAFAFALILVWFAIGFALTMLAAGQP